MTGGVASVALFRPKGIVLDLILGRLDQDRDLPFVVGVQFQGAGGGALDQRGKDPISWTAESMSAVCCRGADPQ